MARRKTGKRPPPARITSQRLAEGWHGPAGTRLRLVSAADLPAYRELLGLAHVEVEDNIAAQVEAGRGGRLLSDALNTTTEAMTKPLVLAASEGRLPEAAAELSLCLVAATQQGQVVGALLGQPSGNVSDTIQKHAPEHGDIVALLSMVKVAKIKGLAVEPSAQGQGIGAVLLKRAVQLYLQLEYFLVYGQFPTGSGLETYYARQGFAVLEEGEGTNIGAILTGTSILLGAGPGERLFTRWR